MHPPTAKLCTYEVNLKARYTLGIIDFEKDNPIPFSDESLATICEQIHQRLPKVRKKTWTRKKLKKGATSEHQNHTGTSTSTFCSNTKQP
jgi:hypothetical protein